MQKPVRSKHKAAEPAEPAEPSSAAAPASLGLSPPVADRLKEHRDFALRVAYSIVKNRADAEDAVAESCYRALRFADTYDSKKPFDRWLRHIVTMVCYEWIRAAKAQKRPQTVAFSQLVVSSNGSAGGGDEIINPFLDAPDPNADVAGVAVRRVAADSVGAIWEGSSEAGDLPEWLLDGLQAVPEPDRALLLDVYVRQTPRKEAARALGVNEYRFNQRLLEAQKALRSACAIVPAGMANRISGAA